MYPAFTRKAVDTRSTAATKIGSNIGSDFFCICSLQKAIGREVAPIAAAAIKIRFVNRIYSVLSFTRLKIGRAHV